MSSVQPWSDAFRARAASLPGASIDWLAQRRQQAINRFADEGWPGAKQEGWRHTSLASLEQSFFGWADGGRDARGRAEALLQPLKQSQTGHWLVFVDGVHDAALSDIGSLPSGVRIETLAAAVDRDPAALEGWLGDADEGASVHALNLAFAADGAFVSLPRGAALEAPIHLVFLTLTGDSASFVRNIIVADNGAIATVVEHYLGENGLNSFTNTATRTFLASDANITHLKLQQEGDKTFHIGAIDITQEGKSSHESHSLSFGARLARTDIATHLLGTHCETLLNGLYFVDGRRHVDHHTLINHAHPYGTSREYYRGILADASRGVFNGRILVAEGADRTDAIQRSDSLLLSRLARSDAQPELEIYADDVKCAHGATVGQLDADSLFYLRSRGMDKEHARSMLIYAFAAEALQRIQSQSLRASAIGAIRGLLPGGDVLGELA
ncbi:Fe-S cluster assembly protein SufD [Paracandidimonas soli]|uniref:Fe-S cluster assembly protein SufD n=1 Tax=Paracandidimonas soli TaxID=1917182 RepID=UPI003342CB08